MMYASAWLFKLLSLQRNSYHRCCLEMSCTRLTPNTTTWYAGQQMAAAVKYKANCPAAAAVTVKVNCPAAASHLFQLQLLVALLPCSKHAWIGLLVKVQQRTHVKPAVMAYVGDMMLTLRCMRCQKKAADDAGMQLRTHLSMQPQTICCR
jgi:hypothetical protein